MINVSIDHIDGSHREWNEGDDLVRRMVDLQGDGLSGKDLVDALLGDDWAAPPTRVAISGTLHTGERVDFELGYD